MSRANIVSMGWVSPFAFHVTFESRSGDRTYEYSSIEGAAIAAGGDPHDYSGVEVGTLDSAQNIAEDLEEVGEFAELVAL
jgi:hypothetical protein